MPQNTIVLGAGVSGLTTALCLARSNGDNGKHIAVVAKHMPGDYDIEYTSPWAGANFGPLMTRRPAPDSNELGVGENWERATWPELQRLASSVPEAGVEFERYIRYRRAKDAKTSPSEWVLDGWYQHEMSGFRLLDDHELPPGIDAGVSITSVCINVPIYLSWLVSQCLKLGVVFHRAVINHITDAPAFHHSNEKASLIINCTGLSSLRLGGVQDQKLYPSRGQIVVVRNTPLHHQPTMYSISGTDDGLGEAAYIMHRPAGGGCVLGGCMQDNNWESQPDMNLAVRIMKRCVEMDPGLVEEGKGIEGLSIVRHTVGLRPMREGGPRCEKEVVGDVQVVHNYGHGGGGYEKSYGAAKAVVRLVEEIERQKL